MTLNDYKRAVRMKYEQDVEHCRGGKCFKTKHIIMRPEDLDAEIDSLLAWVEGEVTLDKYHCSWCKPKAETDHQKELVSIWEDARKAVKEKFKALRGTNEPNV